MPATFDSAFALWLTQHGSERSIAVNVLQFSHAKWNATTGPIYVSDFGEDFTATTEPPTSVAFTATPLGFMIDATADNVSTEQRIMVRIDNAHGAVAQQLRSLTDEDLLTPVSVTYRTYLDTDRSGPVIDPLTMYATNINMNRLTVECEITADYLPNVGAGTRYTIEDYPPLAYL
jgi:hypothetical protein